MTRTSDLFRVKEENAHELQLLALKTNELSDSNSLRNRSRNHRSNGETAPVRSGSSQSRRGRPYSGLDGAEVARLRDEERLTWGQIAGRLESNRSTVRDVYARALTTTPLPAIERRV